MENKIRKVIIQAEGLGTRFLSDTPIFIFG